MSVATQFFAPGYDPEFDPEHPVVDSPARRPHLRAVPAEIPGGARPGRRHAPAPAPVLPSARGGASVAVLLAPEPEQLPVRLTRRGVVVLALLVAALGAVLVWVAAMSSPSDPASGGTAPTTASVVTVEAGDTLWSIAGRVAPGTDPRAEVEHLRALNSLDDVALVPGQQLQVK